VVDSNGSPVSGFVLDGNRLEHASFDLLHGDSVTLTVSGVAGNTIEAGDTVVNTATIFWGSLDSSNPFDGADSFDPLAESQQSASDSDSFSIADLSKSIISTGIDSTFNSNSQAVTGEYITYQLVIDVPQGVTSMAEIRDTLDEGLAFDSLIAVVANTAGVVTDLGAGDFSDIAAPARGTAGDLQFQLGTIINNDQNNSTVETLALTYRVYVANEAIVQPGVLLNNNATLRWDIDNDGTPEDVTTASATPVTVLEPVISVSKSSDDPAPHLGQYYRSVRWQYAGAGIR